ncbi:MAG: ABC transporter substrate-binding protein [Firmicutes bacterium]|nr:ABC transporter substrate-binding protein [Bacillota bacterium]MDD4263555.1 ABC transporter substrate-binding protein [Bacillota bacterium]MDD4692910.1 ABC transporter substrate-binding protein [Bacillota bacterium]
MKKLQWLISLIFILSLITTAVDIGIIQILEHPALDAARAGFMDELKEQGINATYDYQNAQGDMATLYTIAGNIVADKVDLILAIATPSAQAAANATSQIPILITAVTDPKIAGLVKEFDKPGTNVTGTSDMNPVEKQLELILSFAPKATRIGIIYNGGEANSVVQIDLAQQAAKKLGLKLVLVTVSETSGVFQATQSLQGRVDAVYVPTDNTVVAALESVISFCERNKLPLIAGETESVERGALATIGLNYYDLGRQTGAMAVKILNGADPAETPIEFQENINLTVNKSAAKRMGFTIPDEILKEAIVVE